MLLDRRTLAIRCLPSPALGVHHGLRGADGTIAPSRCDPLLLLLQSMRLYLTFYYSWEADLRPSMRFVKPRGCRCRAIMAHRHRRTSWAADTSTMIVFSHPQARFVRFWRALWAG